MPGNWDKNRVMYNRAMSRHRVLKTQVVYLRNNFFFLVAQVQLFLIYLCIELLEVEFVDHSTGILHNQYI